MKVLVFEKNEQSKLTIKRFLAENYPEINILTFVDSFENAKILIEYHNPDFIFADAVLNGMSVFAIMQELKDIKAHNFVLMTTQPEFALQGISYTVLDYVHKPLVPEHLNLTINTLKRKILQHHPITSQITPAKDAYPFIGISSIDKIEVIIKKEIIYAEADGRYTHFNLSNQTIKTATKNLGEIEKLLAGNDFLRVHHSFIVNMNYVKSISKTDGYTIELKTTSKTIPVSKRKQSTLMRFLQIKY